MIKKLVFIVIFSLIVCDTFSQKIIEREYDATMLSTIEINSEIVFSITISAEKVKTVKIRTSIEGENFENIMLGIKEEDGKLSINPEFPPYFEVKNDKLAAHKVIAIEMELIIPENFNVIIKSSLSSVFATGNFLSIEALLGVGNCIFENFSGDAKIKTNEGFIKVLAHNTVFGAAFSKNGNIINELNKKGSFKVEAESLEGDISLFQIE